MFILSTRQETVKLPPSRLSTNLPDAVRAELNSLYCNRIIPGGGLAIAIMDVLYLGEPVIHPGNPHICIDSRFRVIVFRPLQGEVLVGQVRSCTVEGVHVTLGFFDDILIPPRCMQPGTSFDPTEQSWIWNYGEGGEGKLFIDVGELIRFRVLQEHFVETKDANIRKHTTSIDDTTASSGSSVPPPYRITASIAEDGLGLLSWWPDGE